MWWWGFLFVTIQTSFAEERVLRLSSKGNKEETWTPIFLDGVRLLRKTNNDLVAKVEFIQSL